MLSVEIVTPERIVHQTEGEEITVPTLDGMLGIRTGHLPLIAPLKAGEVTVKRGSRVSEHFAVAGGFVEVLPGSVRILVDVAEHAEELDEAAIQEAMSRAQELKANAADTESFTHALGLIELNLARQRVAQRKRTHGSRTEVPGEEQG